MTSIESQKKAFRETQISHSGFLHKETEIRNQQLMKITSHRQTNTRVSRAKAGNAAAGILTCLSLQICKATDKLED